MMVSIIIPTCESYSALRNTVDSVLSQSYDDLEVLFVDCCQGESSHVPFEGIEESDQRVRMVSCQHEGLGSAYNEGLAHCKGDWIVFLEAGVILDELFLERMLSAGMNDEEGHCDIVACDYLEDLGDGKPARHVNHATADVSKDGSAFSYRKMPGTILQAAGLCIFNKIYRHAFLVENHLTFDADAPIAQALFSGISFAHARRIKCDAQPLATDCRQVIGGKSRAGMNLISAESIVYAIADGIDRLRCLPYAHSIQASLYRWTIDLYLNELDHATSWNEPYYALLYERAHALFSSPGWDEVGVGLFCDDLYMFPKFDAVRRNDLDTMRSLTSHRLIVSLTSYPLRMAFVPSTISTLLEQTLPPDLIVLWLSADEFPNGLEDVSEELLSFVRSGALSIRWCEGNLKSHKKYLYSLREFADDVVVLADDDLLYDKKLLERLWHSYLQHPEAISAARTHLILPMADGDGFEPYMKWPQEVGDMPFVPSMRLLATTGAGSLYPPHLMPEETFDVDAILSCCPNADDLWLKAAEVIAGIPVTAALVDQRISYVPGSQVECLFKSNGAGGNDEQLKRISDYLDSKYWPGVFERGVIGYGNDVFCLFEALILRNKSLARENLALSQRVQTDRRQAGEKLKEAEAVSEKLRLEIKRVRMSKSFRLGRALTKIPRAMRQFFRNLLGR